MQPQGGMQGVNSMTQPVNSMQMTQAQGLISPFSKETFTEEEDIKKWQAI